MRLDVTKQEFQTLIDALKGNILKCERKIADHLLQRLEWQLNGKGPDDPHRTFVPMVRLHGYNFDGMARSSKTSHWSYKPRRSPKTLPLAKSKPTKSAQDILDSI